MNFNPEEIAQNMRQLADSIGNAYIISLETNEQAEAFERFMHHYDEMVKTARLSDSDGFIKHLEAAYYAGRIIVLGLKSEQISIIAGGA